MDWTHYDDVNALLSKGLSKDDLAEMKRIGDAKMGVKPQTTPATAPHVATAQKYGYTPHGTFGHGAGGIVMRRLDHSESGVKEHNLRIYNTGHWYHESGGSVKTGNDLGAHLDKVHGGPMAPKAPMAPAAPAAPKPEPPPAPGSAAWHKQQGLATSGVHKSEADRYHTCPECEANFKGSDIKGGVMPPHKFNNKPCPGSGCAVEKSLGSALVGFVRSFGGDEQRWDASLQLHDWKRNGATWSHAQHKGHQIVVGKDGRWRHHEGKKVMGQGEHLAALHTHLTGFHGGEPAVAKAHVAGYEREGIKGTTVRVLPYETHTVVKDQRHEHGDEKPHQHEAAMKADTSRALESHGWVYHGAHPHLMTNETGHLYSHPEKNGQFVHLKDDASWSAFHTDGQIHVQHSKGKGPIAMHLHLNGRRGDCGDGTPSLKDRIKGALGFRKSVALPGEDGDGQHHLQLRGGPSQHTQWSHFHTNPQGGGFGTNAGAGASKTSAWRGGVRGIPEGTKYHLHVNGKFEATHTRGQEPWAGGMAKGEGKPTMPRGFDHNKTTGSVTCRACGWHESAQDDEHAAQVANEHVQERHDVMKGAGEHAAFADHTKNPYHKILTEHGFVHASTAHRQNPFAKDNPKADSTEHTYVPGPGHPHLGRKTHIVVSQEHDRTVGHGGMKSTGMSWRHRHEQDNGIIAPTHGETKPSLARHLNREYGTGIAKSDDLWAEEERLEKSESYAPIMGEHGYTRHGTDSEGADVYKRADQGGHQVKLYQGGGWTHSGGGKGATGTSPMDLHQHLGKVHAQQTTSPGTAKNWPSAWPRGSAVVGMKKAAAPDDLAKAAPGLGQVNHLMTVHLKNGTEHHFGVQGGLAQAGHQGPSYSVVERAPGAKDWSAPLSTHASYREAMPAVAKHSDKIPRSTVAKTTVHMSERDPRG